MAVFSLDFAVNEEALVSLFRYQEDYTKGGGISIHSFPVYDFYFRLQNAWIEIESTVIFQMRRMLSEK